MSSGLTSCPSCGEHLAITRLSCSECGLSIEGKFTNSRFALLSPEQQRFAEVFIKARGNIKEVEKELDLSYPTVRKKLDDLVTGLGYAVKASEDRKREVLDSIESGQMSAREGIELLKNIP